MADISGTNLVAPVVPFTSEDSYPTHMAQYGKGGWRSVQTKAELATIPSQRLEVGMVAYVIEESTPYVYDGQDWKALVIEMNLSKVATEATLIAGIASIEEKIENKSVDLTSVAKEETLKSESQTIQSAIQNIDLSSVESKVDAVGAKIDNISLPEIDTTELAKEATLNNLSSKIDNINVDVDLSSVAKQGTNDSATNTAILDAVGNIQLDKSDLAKQGSNQEATNSKILEEVQNKLTPLEAVLTELNNGKEEMVDALKLKNVESSTNKTLSAIAKDIRSIAQKPLTIDGGEMYEKQLFGAVTHKTVNYSQPNSPTWNLYQVMANLLNDGRFITYGGIVLCEYSKDNPDIQLVGAGAGGAYLTSDYDVYYKDTIHTWHDYDDEKENRWVAYFLFNELIDFTIPSPSPYRIHIGRKVGCIKSSVTGTTIKDIVCTDGNEFSLDIAQTNACGDALVLNNLSKFDKPLKAQFLNGCTRAMFDIKGELTSHITEITSSSLGLYTKSIIFKNIGNVNIKTNNRAILELIQRTNAYFYTSYISFPKGYRLTYRLMNQFPSNTSKVLTIDGIEKLANHIIYNMNNSTNTTLEKIHMPDLEIIESGGCIITTNNSNQGGVYSVLKSIVLPKLKEQRRSIASFPLTGFPDACKELIDVEVGAMETSFSFNNWKPSGVLADADKIVQLNKNIRDHIAAKVTDRNELEPLTATFSQELRDVLTEETEQAFRDKNWNVAPAKTTTE